MINWKKDTNVHKKNKNFLVIKKLRSEMIEEILHLNKKQKSFSGQFITKKHWCSQPTEILLLALTELLNNKK